MREGREREPFDMLSISLRRRASLPGQSGKISIRLDTGGRQSAAITPIGVYTTTAPVESSVSHYGNWENVTQLRMENCFPICTNIPPQVILFVHRQPVSVTH